MAQSLPKAFKLTLHLLRLLNLLHLSLPFSLWPVWPCMVVWPCMMWHVPYCLWTARDKLFFPTEIIS